LTLLFIYGFISIFFSFLCSILEAVLLSISPTFINIKKKENKHYAFILEELKRDVDKPLIVILTINTIAHTVGAILVGVQSEKTFGTGNNMVGIVSAIMTFLILVLSEIIPKTIGATYWKKLANFTARTLRILIFPLKWTGILWLLQFTTRLIGKDPHKSVLSRTEFSVMADVAREKGVINETESNVIKNLVNFKLITAKDIMTPRTVMHSAPADKNIKEFFDENKNIRFSRIPIYSDNPDNISGYVLKDEVLENIAEDKDELKLKDMERKITIIGPNTPIPVLFEKFIDRREHIALIIDEFGAVNGIVTMEDVIETLLGLEIMDELDIDKDMQKLARKIWEKRASKYGLLREE
jgi:CBS domain containing-hemolysin-like protein